MTWVILVWTGLIVAWMVSAGNSTADSAASCTDDAYLSAQDCADATNVGGGLAIMFIGFVGFIGFVALALVWFMTRPKQVQKVYVVSPEQAAQLEQQ
jgi:hypothetical protein